MKKTALILAIITLITTNCDYLKKKGFIGNKKRMKEYIDRLENTIRDDSIEYVAQMEKLKKESQVRIDSIQKSCGGSGSYHVITGSFRNPVYADNFAKEMVKLGYKSQIIVASNGFNLVSAFACSNYKEVLNALYNLRSSVNQESWLYIKN
jgi:hypothetical protein